jgi:hypothetical protein
MKRLAMALVVVLSLVSVGSTLAVDEEPPASCTGVLVHPVAEAIAALYPDDESVDYDAIMEWFCKGYGMGEIRIALSLAATSGDNGPTWEDLLAAKTDGVGWGQIRIALWMTRSMDEDSDLSWEDLLERRADGAGWGEIRQELGLIGRSRTRATDPQAGDEPLHGPPPHAGPKWRGGEDRPGPPPHAGPKDK